MKPTVSSIENIRHAVPFIGAEIFIEPGQSPELIDTWFRRMKECGMTVTRIRLFEVYMRRADGSWDFALFDQAFAAAEKHGIKVYGNLFPATEFTDVGGFKFPGDNRHADEIALYIREVVNHFKSFPALYGWVPINEPGSGTLPDSEFTRIHFASWKVQQKNTDYISKGYPKLDFSEQQFLLHHNTVFLRWLTGEIRKHDTDHTVHVNNHAVFQHVAEYDFPEWVKFLDTLGGSAHVSWHFGYFRRDQFTVGMSAKSEIIRSGAGEIPWFMTELQGGNNTYSAFHPLCPTKEEIVQWLWTVIFTGGKGAIFWCLNARSSGFEAGEWAMLNFQQEPTDRLLAAGDVAAVLATQSTLFADAVVVPSGISIVYVREAMWIEKALQVPGTFYEGRSEGGVMKSALAWFEALAEMGIQANFSEMGEMDFEQESYSGKTIILSHQVSLPSRYWKKLENFVSRGGKIIADGLTGFYDEHAHCVFNTGFPLRELFGGSIKEFKLVGNLFEVQFSEQDLALPAHLWRGTIEPGTATPLSFFEGEVIASRNIFNTGEVVWIPSLVGLGCRIAGDYRALATLLYREAESSIVNVPFRFTGIQPGMLLKTLKSTAHYLTVIINKSAASREVRLIIPEAGWMPRILFSTKNGTAVNNTLTVFPEETMVMLWESPE